MRLKNRSRSCEALLCISSHVMGSILLLRSSPLGMVVLVVLGASTMAQPHYVGSFFVSSSTIPHLPCWVLLTTSLVHSPPDSSLSRSEVPEICLPAYYSVHIIDLLSHIEYMDNYSSCMSPTEVEGSGLELCITS